MVRSSPHSYSTGRHEIFTANPNPFEKVHLNRNKVCCPIDKKVDEKIDRNRLRFWKKVMLRKKKDWGSLMNAPQAHVNATVEKLYRVATLEQLKELWAMQNEDQRKAITRRLKRIDDFGSRNLVLLIHVHCKAPYAPPRPKAKLFIIKNERNSE
jgi:hypothetical protein